MILIVKVRATRTAAEVVAEAGVPQQAVNWHSIPLQRKAVWLASVTAWGLE